MVGTYQFGLVALSLFIATLASYVALELAGRVTNSRGLEARLWLGCGAVSMGIGIWSMHFIGMLAFRLPISLAYDISTTLISLAIAIGVSGFALKVASRASLDWRNLVIAGVLMGSGISSMHYTGMAALTVTPSIVYDPLIFAASITIAIVAAMAALWIAFRLRQVKSSQMVFWQIVSAFVMGLAIAGMHYTGMLAAHFAAGTICISGQGFDTFLMATLVAGFSVLISGVTLLIGFLDGRMRLRTASLEQDKSHLEVLAMKDALTQLPNRRLLEQRIIAEIANDAASRFAILFIDLDRFKSVNDSLGHHIGDRLLRAVATRLQQSTRATDTVARLGGDEFVVMLKADSELHNVVEVANRIQKDITAPIQIEGHELNVTSSIGIAVYPTDGTDPHSLIVNADTAMYQVKKRGRNRYQFFSSDMDNQSRARFELESELRLALKNGDFELHYQPISEVRSGRIVSVEALARWPHPVRGYVSPIEFIPLAEELGLIAALGQWVLETACRQARAWQDAGLPGLTMAVNISPYQLDRRDFEQMVTDTLVAAGLDGRYLELEITEGTLLYNIESASNTLFRLHKLGITVAIDDFGVGYSSLQYLRKLPIDKLKIDRSFITDIVTDADDEAIVRAMISVGHSLRLQVVAEGVETTAQLARLRTLGCDRYQGYLRAKPMPAAEFATLFRSEMPTADLAEIAT
jgi:diguanylate cyclase (GGDEF)-like protein